MNLSSSFVEGLITIIVTAILIPFIFRVIDDRKAEQQRKIDDLKQRKNKEFEAELSRQSKVIEAQVQFIEKLADLLWEYQLTAIDVSYYYLNLGLSEQYQQMSQNYLDTAGPLLILVPPNKGMHFIATVAQIPMFLLANQAGIKGEIPGTVEGFPGGALVARIRMFRTKRL